MLALTKSLKLCEGLGGRRNAGLRGLTHVCGDNVLIYALRV